MTPAHSHFRRACGGRAPRRRCAAVVAFSVGALAAGALLSACGSAATLTSRQLVQRADAICLRVNREAAAVVSGLAVPRRSLTARQTFIQFTEATLPLSDRGLAQLRTLAAPDSLRADWERFLSDTEREDAGEHQLVQAARRADLRRGESIQVAMQNAASDLQQVTARDGFAVCGRPQKR